MNNILIGKFIEEQKNRFLCDVEIDGSIQECYISSSCRLSNFVNLIGKDVLLAETKSKTARTRFKVIGVKDEGKYIPLDMSAANKAVEADIHRRLFCSLGKRKKVIREKTVGGYKSDFYIEDTNTILEIKSVLSWRSRAVFPTIYSERAEQQLTKIVCLLNAGYNVHYILVSLNPGVRQIEINKEIQSFSKLFHKCIKYGMKVDAFSMAFEDGEYHVGKRIGLIIE